MDNEVVACVPVDSVRLGLPAYTPRNGFTVTTCDRCHEKMWIGPRQELKRQQDHCLALCIICCRDLDPDLKSISERIKHLGG